jgi:hypothetical protein
VPLRIVANGDGVTVMMTFFQPPVMTDQQFDQAMNEMDIEMNKLKEILESSAIFESLPSTKSAPAAVQIVQDLYAAFAHRDFPKIFSLLSSDVEITQSTKLPWGSRISEKIFGVFFGFLGPKLPVVAVSRISRVCSISGPPGL